jgi:hypothetical protein
MADDLTNPYDWRRHRPKVEIRRANVEDVAEDVAADLHAGGSGALGLRGRDCGSGHRRGS